MFVHCIVCNGLVLATTTATNTATLAASRPATALTRTRPLRQAQGVRAALQGVRRHLANPTDDIRTALQSLTEETKDV